MSPLILRLVCGVLFAALVLGAVVRPPDNLTQGLGMLLPAAMLLSVALKGPRRNVIPKKRAPPIVTSSGELPPGV
ncbi:hypothetical protein ACLESO_44250 [Pyxidicoccus sp. 3LG]